MARKLAVVGLSHKTASVELRERAAFPDRALSAALSRLRSVEGVSESMILSTCNRVELYAAVDETVGVDPLRSFFCADGAGGRSAAELGGHTYAHVGDAAVAHLFAVASSLDSMVVGESQILGQVKEAWRLALEAGATGPLLSRTLPRAFGVAKRVRTETEVARNSASVASAAVDLAVQIFGGLERRQVLVVGAGKMGDLAARHLMAAGAQSLTVINRTRARAEEVAARLGGRALPWEELDRALERADVVVSSTGAAEPVITRERVSRAMRARKGRWLCFLDIALPRDIDPLVGTLENVYLYDLDALQQAVAQNLADRGREAALAQQIVDEELVRFQEAEQALGVVPTLKALREHFLDVARSEVERTVPRLGELPEAKQKLVAHMAEAIVNKLLHGPLTQLRQEARERPGSEELVLAVHRLFGLGEGQPEGVGWPRDEERAAEERPRDGKRGGSHG